MENYAIEASEELNRKYKSLIRNVLSYGVDTQRRNGMCRTLPGASIDYYLGKDAFPIVSGRKIYYKGVLGEFAAFIRGPKKVEDFKKWGCNYWDSFGDENGNLKLDYGNAWLLPLNQLKEVGKVFKGLDMRKGQLQEVVEMIKKDKTTRRALINGWVNHPDDLTLPCCHFAYQFIVTGKALNLVWYQRSADVMVGVPSDMVLANLMLILMAKEVDLLAGGITMHFGDTHIYQEHLDITFDYLARPVDDSPTRYTLKEDASIFTFKPDDIEIYGYKPTEFPHKFALIK